MPITPDDLTLIQAKANWASESTLQKILAAMPGRRGRSETPEEKRAREAAERNADAVNQNTSFLKKAVSGVGGQWSSAIKDGIRYGFKGPTGILDTFGSSLTKVGQNLDHVGFLGTSAGVAGFALTEMAKGVRELIKVNDTFLNIYASGVRLQGGLYGLLTASQDSGMTVQEFGSLLEKHSSTVAMLGSTRTPALIKQFQELTNRGSELMMTQGEANDAFLQTSEILFQTGQQSSMALGNLEKSSRALIVETNTLSKETGQSRKSILEFVGTITKTGTNFLLMSTMTEQARKGFASAAIEAQRFGQTAGKMLMDNVQKMITGKGGLGLLDENFRMMASVVPGGMDALQNLQQAIAGGDDKSIKSAMEVFGKTMASAPKPLVESLLISMPEVANALGEFARNQERIQKKLNDDLAADTKEAKRLNLDVAVVTQRRIDREKAEEQRNIALQASLNEMDAATKNLNTEFSKMYVSVGQVILPVLKKFAEFINGILGVSRSIGSGIGRALGQSKEEAEATGGGFEGTFGTVLMGAGAYGAYRGLRKLRQRGVQGPPTPPGDIVPPSPPGGGGGGGGGRFARFSPRAAGMAGIAGMAGGLLGTAIGGTGGNMLASAASMGATGAMLGSFFGLPGTIIGGLAGAGLGAYQAWKASKEEQAAGGIDRTQYANPLAQIDAILEGRDSLNLRYTETGKAMLEFSKGYKEVVNSLNLGIDARNITNFARLQDLVTGRSQGLLASDFAGINLAQATQTYYERSSTYQDRSLEIWRDIRTITQSMRDDINNLKGLVDTYVRGNRTAPAGSPQTRQ